MRLAALAAGLFGLAFGAVAGAAAPVASAAGADVAARARPDIVLIVTDDEDWKAHEYLPRVRRLLDESGATFANYFVSYSLCCPSRASILRGQYPHNHGVLGNRPPDGGYAAFVEAGHEVSTIATWLQAGGYYTSMIGKYLNGYGEKQGDFGPSHVPPGWSDWHGLVGGARYFDYDMSSGGRLVHYGHDPADYSTDVLRDLALAAIRTAAARHEPLFLYLAPRAPHLPADPAPRHAAMFADVDMPEGAAFDEEDERDKPAAVRNRPRVNAFQAYEMRSIFRHRLRSLQAVDELVEAVIEELRATGRLGDAYVIYTSDNGYHLGEHRLGPGKNTPYEEDIRVPLLIRGPGVPAGSVVQSMAVNIDLAPTIVELAGVSVPPWVDGRSLTPLWRGGPADSRRCLLVQRGPNAAIQADEGDDVHTPFGFHALRTEQYLYAVWSNGERELYDVLADPAELRNLAGTADPALVGVLGRRLDAISRCRAAECRRLEDLPLTTAPAR